MTFESSNTAFQAIWFAPSFILGLGIARLFSDGITLFRSRHKAQIDWIPLVWAVVIFVWQIQYLWAILELPRYVKVWTLPEFIMLLGLSLTLFISASLILPDAELRDGENLQDTFLRDGRWSLVSLSGWGCLALLVNWLLFETPITTLDGGLMSAATILPLLFLSTKNRRLKEILTISNLILTVVASWILSPKSY
jgi:hypothetical protein